jgi:rod shape-determining protein MreD
VNIHVHPLVVLRAALVIFTVAIVHTELLVELRIFDVAPDPFVLIAVAAGLTAGPDRGAAMGFAAGLTFDLFLPTPFGLSALVYCITGYLVGQVENALVRPAWWISGVFAAGGTAFGVIGYVLVGELLGQKHLLSELPDVIGGTVLYNAALAPLVVRVIAWVWRAAEDAPRPLRVDRVLN